MKEKLDQFTIVNGNSVEKNFMQLNILVLGMLLLFSLGSSLFMGSGFARSNMLLNIGLLPYLIMGFQVPLSTYNIEYFQKARYYMISVVDVFKYHLSQVYSIKNIIVWILLCTLFDVVVSLANGEPFFQIMPIITFGYVLSPAFIGCGFLIGTWFGRNNLWKRIVMFVVIYVLFIVMFVSLSYDGITFNALPFIFGGALLFLLLVYLMVKQRDKHMEV